MLLLNPVGDNAGDAAIAPAGTNRLGGNRGGTPGAEMLTIVTIRAMNQSVVGVQTLESHR